MTENLKLKREQILEELETTQVLDGVSSHPFFELSEVVMLPVEELVPHPERDLFPALEGEQKELLKESVSKDGILHNLVVADKGLISSEKYTILSGHNRWEIAKELGIKKIPCRIVRISSKMRDLYEHQPEAVDLSPQTIYDTLLEIVIEANLAQRIIDPTTFLRCIKRREAALKRWTAEKDFLEKNLIPELRSALHERKLPYHLAKVLAEMPQEQQRQFISLIGGEYGRVQQMNLESLKRALSEKEEELAKASKRIRETEEVLRDLRTQLEALKMERQKHETKIMFLNQEKEKLLRKIQLLESQHETHTDPFARA